LVDWGVKGVWLGVGYKQEGGAIDAVAGGDHNKEV